MNKNQLATILKTLNPEDRDALHAYLQDLKKQMQKLEEDYLQLAADMQQRDAA